MPCKSDLKLLLSFSVAVIALNTSMTLNGAPCHKTYDAPVQPCKGAATWVCDASCSGSHVNGNEYADKTKINDRTGGEGADEQAPGNMDIDCVKAVSCLKVATDQFFKCDAGDCTFTGKDTDFCSDWGDSAGSYSQEPSYIPGAACGEQ